MDLGGADVGRKELKVFQVSFHFGVNSSPRGFVVVVVVVDVDVAPQHLEERAADSSPA